MRNEPCSTARSLLRRQHIRSTLRMPSNSQLNEQQGERCLLISVAQPVPGCTMALATTRLRHRAPMVLKMVVARLCSRNSCSQNMKNLHQGLHVSRGAAARLAQLLVLCGPSIGCFCFISSALEGMISLHGRAVEALAALLTCRR